MDSPKETSGHSLYSVLNSVHLYFLAGCFGLCVISRFEAIEDSHLFHHYRDGITSAHSGIQKRVRNAVHNIYRCLVQSLAFGKRTDDGSCGTEKLLLVNVFALSVKYQPPDISLAVETDILTLLSSFCGKSSLWYSPQLWYTMWRKTSNVCKQLDAMLRLSSLRLLQIISIATGYVVNCHTQHLLKIKINTDLCVQQRPPQDVLARRCSTLPGEGMKVGGAYLKGAGLFIVIKYKS